MPRHHRLLSLLTGIAIAAVFFAAAPELASANHREPADGSEHDFGDMVDYPMVFPVTGDYHYWDTFWACRGNPCGPHHAQDIMADKMTPVVAPVAGTVSRVNYSSNPDDLRPDRCCTLVIEHEDGWQSWYLHLNNDTPGTDDGEGWGIAPGIVPGAHVSAGQLIGWVGDSGNAENAGSHLHFELRDPEGIWVNSYEALRRAEALGTSCSDDAEVCRHAGMNRYGTAAAVTAHEFDDAPIVFVGTGEDYPDVLAGTAVAGKLGAPMLLVRPNAIPSETVQQLQRLDPDDIVLLGGTSVISSSLESNLAAYGTTVRLSGATRYETAVAISQFGFPSGSDVAFVVTGDGYVDALSAGPAAAALGGPLLLTAGGALPGVVATELERLGPTHIHVVGGPAVVSNAVMNSLQSIAPTTRVSGADRYGTALAVRQLAFPGPADRLFVAVGTNYPDALTGGAAAGAAGAPLALVPPTHVPSAIESDIASISPSQITILGGTAVVSVGVELELRDLFSP